ncbi:28S ribosomal protein S36, mitochondrial [Folsomia candida]|nr:28S ribosomal protein S36, mitochondrial [Folsomia candida]
MKPSPSAVSQAFKSLKPHVPLIKFRKGSGTSHHVGQAGPTPSPVVAAAAARFPSAPATPLKQNEAYQLPSIEDWQLPSRFQRRPLDEEEIAFINRGGPDKL